jgi:hypothetical protein
LLKPILDTAFKTHSDKAGVNISHALDDPLRAGVFASGAIHSWLFALPDKAKRRYQALL